MANNLTIEEALDYCLTNPDGLTVPEMLTVFPEYRTQLEPLLTLALGIQSVEVPPVDAARKAAIRQRLMARAASMPVASAGTAPMRPVVVARNATATRTWSRRFIEVATAAAVVVMFVWWSASSALADSPFYDVKLTTESALLSLSSGPVAIAKGHLALVHQRLEDLQAMARQNIIDKSARAFDNLDFHMNGAVDQFNTTSGQEHTEIARVLYASSTEVDQAIRPLRNISNLRGALATDIEQTLVGTDSANALAAQALTGAGIPPQSIPVPTLPPILPNNTLLPIQESPTPATPEGTPSEVAIEVARLTQTAGIAAEQTSTAQPQGSAVAGATGATTTPTRTAPSRTPTRRVQPTNTVLRIPSSTPRRSTSTPTHTPTRRPVNLTPTHTPTKPSAPPRSTDTRVAGPPTDTPVPTDTRVPPTSTYTHTSTPTYTPLPTATEVPPPPELCRLEISDVSVGCASAGCVVWSSTVTNDGNAPVTASWKAELQVQGPAGPFRTVATQQGSATFPPGDTDLGNTICANIPPDSKAIKVVFTVTSGSPQCDVSRATRDGDPCVQVESTPTAEPPPTHEPHPTREPSPTRRPTHTPKPHPTHDEVPAYQPGPDD